MMTAIPNIITNYYYYYDYYYYSSSYHYHQVIAKSSLMFCITPPEQDFGRLNGKARKGTNGVSTDGVTANVMFFDRDFLVAPVNLLLSPQKCQGLPFSPI